MCTSKGPATNSIGKSDQINFTKRISKTNNTKINNTTINQTFPSIINNLYDLYNLCDLYAVTGTILKQNENIVVKGYRWVGKIRGEKDGDGVRSKDTIGR